MVTMALHNPPIPVIPRAVRVFLACRTSRMTITRVRRTLSETEIERYATAGQKEPYTSGARWMSMVPTTILSTLALSATACSGRTRVPTYRAEVHKAGEGNDPEIHRVDNVTTIELGEGLGLNTWLSERRIKQRTDQKTIS